LSASEGSDEGRRPPPASPRSADPTQTHLGRGARPAPTLTQSPVARPAPTLTVGADQRSDVTLTQSGSAGATLTQPGSGETSASGRVIREWSIGDTILETYAIRALLGEGGMGRVYLAHHLGWGADLAVKSPRSEAVAKSGGTDAFVAEAETWVGLPLHPHVVSCFYVRAIDGLPRIFAEYVDGGSLADWTSDRRLYEGGHEASLERILSVSIQFAWGLSHAHAHGLVHQDVKPANVILSSEGLAKVTDFGLARGFKSGGPVDASAPGVTSGGMTPAYASPEQSAGERLTLATDTWSWACSVLEMFCGQRPWVTGVAAPSVLEELIETGEIADPCAPGVPAELAELLRACLAWDPAERPHEMRGVAATLCAIYRESLDREYPRQEPKEADLRADALNNRAISMLDLGRSSEAKDLLDQALAGDPHHLYATYNRALLGWRGGELTLDAVRSALEAARIAEGDTWENRALLGWILTEAGLAEPARECVAAAEARASGDPRATAAISRVSAAIRPGHRALHEFEVHEDSVTGLSLDPSGARLLSAGDTTVRVWDVATGECLQVLRHEDGVISVAGTPDGRRVVVGGANGQLWVWDFPGGEAPREFKDHPEEILGLAVTPDGRRAYAAVSGGVVLVWDLEAGQVLRTLHSEGGGLLGVDIAEGGERVLAGCTDKRLWTWDLKNDSRLGRSLKGHTGRLRGVACTEDGTRALSASYDGTVRHWDLETDRCLRTLDHAPSVCDVALSADGSLAASGGADEAVRVWDLATGRCLHVLEGHFGRVYKVALSADGRIVASGSDDTTVRVWEIDRVAPEAPLMLARPQNSEQLLRNQREFRLTAAAAREALSQSQQAAAVAAYEQARALPGYAHTAACMSLGAVVSGVARRGPLRGAWLASLDRTHEDSVEAIALTLDGQTALSGSWDRTLRFWPLESDSAPRALSGHTKGVYGLALAADGSTAVSVGADGLLLAWDLSGRSGPRKLAQLPSWINGVCLTPDGRLAVAAGCDPAARVFDVASGRLLLSLTEHSGPVTAVAISDDGQTLVTGSGDTKVRVWDLPSATCRNIFGGHIDNVLCVGLTPCGGLAVSGSQDGTLRVWDAREGRARHVLNGHRESVRGVALSPDGRVAVTAGIDATVRVWELDQGVLLNTLGLGREGSGALHLAPRLGAAPSP
jgi:WD40 repeat protein/serine/threonine protein kinase